MKSTLKILTTLLSVFLMAIFAQSCRKADDGMFVEKQDTIPQLKLSGAFANGPFGSVSGEAKIYLQSGKYYLSLEHFTATDGPALKIYLSQEVLPVNYIKLGDLISINGNQVYKIDNVPDFKKYKYALVHCELYNHLFGSAELK